MFPAVLKQFSTDQQNISKTFSESYLLWQMTCTYRCYFMTIYGKTQPHEGAGWGQKIAGLQSESKTNQPLPLIHISVSLLPFLFVLVAMNQRVGFERLTVWGSGRLGSFSMVIFLASSRFFSLLSPSSACTTKIEQALFLHPGTNIWVKLKRHFKAAETDRDGRTHLLLFFGVVLHLLTVKGLLCVLHLRFGNHGPPLRKRKEKYKRCNLQ